MNRITACVLLSALCLVPSLRAADAANPMIGTWKRNMEKSKNGPERKTDIRRYEDRGNGVIVSVQEGTDMQRKPTPTRYTVKFDGTDYPYFSGNAAVQTIAFTQVDGHTAKFVIKSDGKAVNTGTGTVSQDGRTYTVTGTAANGPYVLVYERQ